MSLPEVREIRPGYSEGDVGDSVAACPAWRKVIKTYMVDSVSKKHGRAIMPLHSISSSGERIDN